MVNINEWNYHTIILVVSLNSVYRYKTQANTYILIHTHSLSLTLQSNAVFDICIIWTGKWCSFMTLQFLPTPTPLSLCLSPPIYLSIYICTEARECAVFQWHTVTCTLPFSLDFHFICWFSWIFTCIYLELSLLTRSNMLFNLKIYHCQIGFFRLFMHVNLT